MFTSTKISSLLVIIIVVFLLLFFASEKGYGQCYDLVGSPLQESASLCEDEVAGYIQTWNDDMLSDIDNQINDTDSSDGDITITDINDNPYLVYSTDNPQSIFCLDAPNEPTTLTMIDIANHGITWIDNGNPCTPSEISIYVYIGCTLTRQMSIFKDCDSDPMNDDDVYYLIAVLNLTIYPPPAPPNIIKINDDCSYFVDYACSGDSEDPTGLDGTNITTNNGLNTSLSPGDNPGTIPIQIKTGNGCIDLLDVPIEECRTDNCPTNPIITGNGEMVNVDICSGGTVEIEGLLTDPADPDNTEAGVFVVTITPIFLNDPIILTTTENFDISQAFPSNTGCEPVTYTVSGSASCNGNNIPSNSDGDLYFTVTVYPEYGFANDPYSDPNLLITEGGCGQASSLIPLCSNYELSVIPDPPIAPEPGAPAITDNYTITYTGDPGNPDLCFDPVSISVTSECNPDCPSEPEITIDGATDPHNIIVCSGATGTTIDITGVFNQSNAVSSGTFTLTESTGTLLNPPPPANTTFEVDIPYYNGCEPVTYTFTATANCDDGTDILGTTTNMTVTVTVYPDYNPDFITITEGSCDMPTDVDRSCIYYLISPPAGGATTPGPGVSDVDTWTISSNYDDIPVDIAPCFQAQEVEVNYDCNPNCPSAPSISADNVAVCSNGTVTITGEFGTAGSTGTTGIFDLTESANTPGILITGPNNDEEFTVDLPTNDGCDPITYTFIATATCSEGGTPIPAITAGDLTVTVTVFPEFNTALLVSTEGTCNNPTGLSSTCSFYAISGNDYQAEPGEINMQTTYTITYNDPDNPNAPDCFIGATSDVSYSCNDACPSDPTLTPTSTNACSNSPVTINTTFGQAGTGTTNGTFTISEASGTITGITPNNSFTLPENTSCDPVTYTFVGTATCDDGSPIFGQNLTTTITVYPEFNLDLLVKTQGTCDNPTGLSSTCSFYTISGNDYQAEPGEINMQTTYTITYNDPDAPDCFIGATSDVPYSCNDACPSDPTLTPTSPNACSDSQVTINTSFGQAGTGTTSGTFTITEASGTITGIMPNDPFTLPENTSCDPVTYTFVGTATCDDSSPIFGQNLTTTITVYPTFNAALLVETQGTCDNPTGLSSTCSFYTISGNDYQAEPGEINMQTTYTINYNDPDAPNCFTGATANVSYSCNDACPSDPTLTPTSPNACSGSPVTINTSFGQAGTSGTSGTFTISEASGTITGITPNNPFNLPTNTSCDPVTYTFVGTATCDDNSPIFGANLNTTITVYPEFNPSLLESTQGTCDNPTGLSSTCSFYQITGTDYQALQGEAASQPYTISYNHPNGCFTTETIEVSYACSDACPSDPTLTIAPDITEACSEDQITITTSFGQSGSLNGTITIAELSGTVTGITDGTAFNLPINNGCDPITYTFVGTATCDDNSPIFGPNLTKVITVYPEFNLGLFNIISGFCEQGGNLTTSCDTYELTEPDPITIPGQGENGNDEWTVTYTGGGNCVTTETINVSYNCNPGCPTQPSISVNTTEVCSGGSATITGAFGNTTGGLTGSFTILDPSGEIAGTITDGSPFNLPINTSCDPIDYTFTADPICDEDGSFIAGSTEDLTVVVTVYPDFNDDFLNITAGSCGKAGELTTSCANYEVTAPSTPTIPQPGDEGDDTWTVEYTGGGTCISSQTVEVEYKCNENCPSEPSISVDNNAVCSGGSVDVTGIFGNVGGGLSGTFSIADPTGEIPPLSNIPSDSPVSITLPTNDGCEPVTYTLSAEAKCEDESLIAGTTSNMTKTITVYPDFNATLISTVDGNCINPGSASSSCELYLFTGATTLPEAGETGSDNLTVDYNYQGNIPAGGACFEAAEITVDYACSSSCPTQPRITASTTNLCSGGTAKIDGTFGQQGSEGGTITITEAGGDITGIVNGESFTLPINNSCDRVSYTFTATATCADGTDITGNVDDLTLQITVYPEFDPEFINITNGACGEAGTATSICDFYELTPRTQTEAEAEQAGTDIWDVTYNDPNAPNCFAGETFEVPYNCGAACPAEPFIEVDKLDICSGGIVTITGNFGQGGAGLGGDFVISEAGGTITGIENGVSFSLPTNNGCDPVSYTFLATAICEDNSIINPAAPEDMSVTVRVYPIFNEAFIEIEPGNCDGPGSAESTCPNYDVQTTDSPTFPNSGEFGEDDWVVNYINTPVTCFANEPIAVPYNCDVACPSSPFLEANSTEICSGGTITLTADFNNNPENSGSFSIIDVAGTITGIQNGVAFTLPENTGCDPIDYTFSASASCSGNPIAPNNPNDVLVTVTVYPDFNEDLVKANPGTCGTPGTLDVICTNYRPTPPDNLISPAAGESGTQIWTVDYIGGINCFSSIPIDVSYACNVSCPEQPRISADNTELCSGGQVRISGVFGVPSNIQPDFEITETSGNITGVVNGTSFTVPENTSCDPIDYTFTAVAFCNGEPIDANNQDMTVTITVYPIFNNNFVSVTNGDCGSPGEVKTTCDNYELTALTTTTPGQGESGTDTWSINYTGSTCIVNEIVQVPYSCGVTCPAGPSISSDKELVCGGESISIVGVFANIDGGQGGYFEITELSGKIENIQNGIEFVVPANNSCDPITYTFSAEAFCDDNTPVFGSSTNLTLSIIVYPEYNENFVNFEPGTCDNVGVATTICDNYELVPQSQTLPESGDSGFDIWTVAYIGTDNFVCFNNATFNVPYSCGQSCPSAPIIEVVGGNNEFCGGASITINGTFRNISDLTGNFEISETSNTIENIENGITFQLPENNGCDPQNYTFTATAKCIDGTEVSGNTTDLTVGVIVYPAFNEQFLNIIPGNCEEAGSISLLCNNYKANPVGTPSIPKEGESDEDIWTVDYIAPNGNGFGCFSGEEIGVPYGCGVTCPSGPSIEAEIANICSGDKAKINGFTTTGENVTFNIIDTKGDFPDIEKGQPFDLPINQNCDPVTYTFTATARCSDGTNIPSDNPADMTVSITVYPVFNESLIQVISGECDEAGTATTLCSNYQLTPPENPTRPGEGASGFDTWTATYKSDEKICFRDVDFNVNFSCNVECPSNPKITTPTPVVCSGDLVKIDGSFQIGGGSGTSGTFDILESSGNIGSIIDGTSFRVPENNTCDPIPYTFRATAQCSNGTTIVGTNENMNLTIIVYPEINDNFISITTGTCGTAGFASTNCANYELIEPEVRTIPQEGEAGNDTWLLNYKTDEEISCIDEIPINVPYSCALDCPSGPRLNVDVMEGCSGDQVIFSSSFTDDGEGFLSGSFTITELKGAIDNIELEGNDSVTVTLPSNRDCDPEKYTFQATATCNGNPITATNPNDLQIIITVYPEYNENLIAVQKGNCNDAGRAVAICDNYEVQGLGSPTIPNQGETGFDQWQVTYIGGNPSNQICIDPVIIDVPYSCGNACPQDPRITAELVDNSDFFGNLLEVCGGESVIFRSSFGIEGDSDDGTFTITSTDIEGDIPIGEAFTLPENKTCDPINYTFLGSAVCDDGEPIPGSSDRIIITIRVYPNELNEDFIDVTPGDCEAAGFVTSSCENYSLIAPLSPTTPEAGQRGRDIWTLSYSGDLPSHGNICVEEESIDVPYNCEENCPTTPSINANTNSICSGGMSSIKAAFADSSSLVATFILYTIINGDTIANSTIEQDIVPSVEGTDIEVKLPENNGCDPITVEYGAKVECVNGEEILSEEGNLKTEIVVYPRPTVIVDETLWHPEGCNLSLETNCNNLVIEYFSPEDNKWSTTPYLNAPFDGDSIEWRAYHKDYSGSCQTTGTAYASGCPQVDNGCPYPVIFAKRNTLDSQNPNSPQSNNGPVVLVATFPISLQPSNFDLDDITYEWGYYRNNDENQRQFIVPGKGSYNTTNWAFSEDIGLSLPGNVNQQFYVVNPEDSVMNLTQYGVLVKTSTCSSSNVVIYIGKTMEDLPTVNQSYLQIYPNPNNGNFNLDIMDEYIKGDIQINIYDYLGRKVHEEAWIKQGYGFQQNISVPNRTAGVYLVELVINGQKILTEKVIMY